MKLIYFISYYIYVYDRIYHYMLIEQGWTALICASIKGHQQIVKLLLEKGADVNIKSSNVGYYIYLYEINIFYKILCLCI